MKSLYIWAGRQVHSRHALLIFTMLVTAEGLIFMPVTMLAILFSLELRKQPFLIALLAIIGSLLGAGLGYFVGHALWDVVGKHIINACVAPSTWGELVTMYQTKGWWAILLASILPFPYVAVTVSAGFCSVPLTAFLSAIAIGRSIRFLTLAAVIWQWGFQIKEIIDHYFYTFVLCGIAMIIISTIGMSYFS